MKYMLIMNTPRDGYTQYMKWPKKLLEANAAFMQAFTKKLKDAGELVAAGGLGSPDQAKLVRAGHAAANDRWRQRCTGRRRQRPPASRSGTICS